MSVWSDSNPITKGVVIVGLLLILVCTLINFEVISIGEEVNTTTTRGVTPPPQ